MNAEQSVPDEDFFHGGHRRPEAVDAECPAVLFQYVEQFLEAGAALVRQQIVQLGPDASLLLHVRHELAYDARDVLLPGLAVLHQRQVIADPCARAENKKLS